MPAPVINPTISINAYKIGQYFHIQLAASNTPTSWAAVGLPEGLEINTASGLISGYAEVAGYWNVVLTATNGDGTSEPLYLPIAIINAPYLLDSSIELNFNLRTGAVTFPGGIGKLNAKQGDKLILSVGFVKDDVLQDLPVALMFFGVKEYEPEKLIVLSDGEVTKIGQFTAARYQILVHFDPAKLKAILSNYEGDKKTAFEGLGELRMTVLHELPGMTEPTPLERASQSFPVEIARNLVPVS